MCQALCLLVFVCAYVITGLESSMWEAKKQKLQLLSIALSSGLHETQLNFQNLFNCRLSSAPNLAFVILVSLSRLLALLLPPAPAIVYLSRLLDLSVRLPLAQTLHPPDSPISLSATINNFTKLCQLSLNNFTLCFMWFFNLHGYKLPFDPWSGGPVLARHQNN